MASESYVSVGAYPFPGLTIQEEITCRAYELYELRRSVDGHHLEDGLRTELPRALCAAAELEKYVNGEVGDTKSVRAARVYLRALSACIGEHGKPPGVAA